MNIPLRFPESGNLYRPAFDTGLVIGLPVFALLSMLLVLAKPEWRGLVIALDLWLLGYHHVIATFTRTAMDRDNLRRYWLLNSMLPLLIFALLFAVGVSSHSAALWISTLYVHWQLFHYIRQSEGISKAYAGRGGRKPAIVNDPICRAAFYLTPITAFLTMAARGQTHFLGFPVWLPQMPPAALMAAWIVTTLFCAAAARRIIASARRGELTPQHLAFVLSHYVVFVVAYAGMRDIVLSWLMANIWHNGQYLAFVWAQNRQRFDNRVDTRYPMLSTLSHRKNIVLYVTFCLAITFAAYHGAAWLIGSLYRITGLEMIAVAAIIYQTINFHHYIVDAIIWRRPKPSHATAPMPAAS